MAVAAQSVCENCNRILDEYRAEIRALRTVLKALEERKHRSGILVALERHGGKAHWVVTCADRGQQRLVADAIGEHITKELAGAFHLTGLVFSGSDADAEESAQALDAGKEPPK